MNNDQFHIDPSLIARFFSGETSMEENRQIQSWKESSPENKKQWDDFQEVWRMMDKITPDRNINIDKEWAHHQNLIRHANTQPSNILSFNTLFKIAASILLLIGFGFGGWFFFNHQSAESPLADIRHLTLPDGSHVTLNAGSKLSFRRSGWNKTRVVSLQGEAYFEVTKNPHLPFIIQLGHADVKVLGTTFNVKAYRENENIEVTVSEGKVSVYNHQLAEKNVIVTRGEKAIFSNLSGDVVKTNNTDVNFNAWKTKVLVFENDSLPFIIQTLKNVYHKNMVIKSKELTHCTITTTFDNKDLETVFHVLKSTLDVTIEEKDGLISISGKGC